MNFLVIQFTIQFLPWNNPKISSLSQRFCKTPFRWFCNCYVPTTMNTLFQAMPSRMAFLLCWVQLDRLLKQHVNSGVLMESHFHYFETNFSVFLLFDHRVWVSVKFDKFIVFACRKFKYLVYDLSNSWLHKVFQRQKLIGL